MRREPTFDDLDFDLPDGGLRPLGAPKPFGRARLAARFAFAAAVIAGLTMFARDRMVPGAAPRVWSEPQAGAAGNGVRAAKPAASPGPLLALDASDPTAKAEPPRWNAATGLREDALTQGSFDAIEAPFLRLTMTEAGPTSEPAASLFITLARRAAEMRGLSVVRTGVRGAIETKFGRFETVEATLSGEGTRLCTGFAAIGTKAMRIDGWLCGVLGQAPEPQAVACAIDGLKLAIAATPMIEVAFGEAELRRATGCGPVPDGAATAPKTDETGSIAGRKTTTGARNSRRSRKNEAELRRNAEAWL